MPNKNNKEHVILMRDFSHPSFDYLTGKVSYPLWSGVVPIEQIKQRAKYSVLQVTHRAGDVQNIKSKNAKHVVLQTDYTKPVIDNDGRVFYPFSSGVVVDDKSSGLKPEIGKSGFVEHDTNQTLSGIQFDKNGNVVKNTYKETPAVNDDTRIPITSSPSVLPNGERREEPYESTDEQQHYGHVTKDDIDAQDKSMAYMLSLASIPFGGWAAAVMNVPQALYTWKHRNETSGVNQFLDYAGVIPGITFTKALNLSTNPAIIRSARLAELVRKRAHPSDIAIRSRQFAAPVATLQMVHKAGDAQNLLTYPSLANDWYNRQPIDTRFDNYLDSPVKPLILNKFAEGGDLDYDEIKKKYNSSNSGVSKINQDTGWKMDYMRDHANLSSAISDNKMKDIVRKNKQYDQLYNDENHDVQEDSINENPVDDSDHDLTQNNVDNNVYGDDGKPDKSKSKENKNPKTLKDYHDNFKDELSLYPQIDNDMQIAYSYLANNKHMLPEDACALIGCALQESRLRPDTTNGSHTGILQWSNKDRYKDLIQFTKDKEGSKYTNGDESLLLNQLDFAFHEMHSDYFNSGKKDLMSKLDDAKTIFDKIDIIKDIYLGGGKYSTTQRAGIAQVVYERCVNNKN